MGVGQLRQCVFSTISQLSVLVVGAAYCWLEPITLRLSDDALLQLSPDDVSWLVSVIELGCFVSPAIAGYVSDRVGRKLVILSVGPFTFLGWTLVLLSKNMVTMAFMRLLHGLAIGVAFTVQPIYTAEIAEPKLRGRLSGTFLIVFYVGILYVFSAGPYLSYDYFVYVSLPLPVAFSTLFLFCPETPYYLLMVGRAKEAKEVLKRLRDGPDVDEEFAAMESAVRMETSEKNPWRILFFDRAERKALLILQTVSAAGYLTGTPVVLNYARETFSKDDSFLPSAEMSILLASLLIAFAAVSAFLSDWVGRRPLLLVSCFGSFVAHFFTGLYYFLHEKTSVDAEPYAWTLYLGLAMYCFFSSIGICPLLQTLQSEMFGASTRGLAGGFIESIAALLAFVTLKAYSPVNEAFGVYLNFWFYGMVALVCWLLLYSLMYETAGKPIGKMEIQMFQETYL